ncbi:MAG: magnesium transporter [Planctomycetia bacterium]|nr:MAG: magnesium transporter [Planctomycetia bacterium]
MQQVRSVDRLDRPTGEFVQTNVLSLRADLTVAGALEQLRRMNIGERVVYFYVTDEEGRLRGVLPTRRLLMSDANAPLRDIMQTRVVRVRADAPLLVACELFVMHRLLAIPVVDDDERLLGAIEIRVFADELLDLSERQAADDVFQLIGVRIAESRGGKPSPLRDYRARFPWLLCNIGGGILCALLAGRYEAFLDSVIVLALFIPVVLALAESVSMQAMTLALQAMHSKRVDSRFLMAALVREMLTAGLLGASCGAIVGVIAWVWKSQPVVALAIGGSIALSVVTACMLGVLLPTVVRVLRGDPRIAAGPMVLAAADVLTLLLYFSLSGALLTSPSAAA